MFGNDINVSKFRSQTKEKLIKFGEILCCHNLLSPLPVARNVQIKIYCDVLPGNASNNLWILDFMLGLLVIYQPEFRLNYYSLNFTVITQR
jgi:hypothetical protein